MTIGQAILLALLVAILWGGLTQILAPERLAQQLKSENEQAAEWIGRDRAERFYQLAQKATRPLFAGYQTASTRTTTPEGESLQVSPLGAKVSDLEPILTQAVFRVLVMVYMLALVSPVLVAAVVDGVIVRIKKREDFASENPRVYHLAKKTMLAVLVAPILIAVLPLGVAPFLAMAWSAIVVITAWGMAQNVEQEV